MNLVLIEQRIIPLLNRYKLSLDSLKTKREFGMDILEIIVDGEKLDTDYLAKVNRAINDLIDDLLPENYYIEVASPGAIRELHSLEAVKKHISKYIHIISDKHNYEGTLEAVKGDLVCIKVNLKGRFKTLEIPYQEINTIKLTVKV